MIRAELSPTARAGRARSPTVLHVLKHWAAWPRRIRWLAGIAAIVLALAIVWALFVPLADWLAHHDVGSATGPLHETALDNARGRLLTLSAGLVAVAALVFTALNFSLLRRNSEQADQWQRRTHELTEQGQVTDRYTKAIEQLGSEKLDVRIGGIYALERIARDSARDHPAVMEVLTAFIREHSQEQWLPSHVPIPEEERLPRPDVQAAVTVVARRDAKRDILPIDLTGADLAGANLARADLASADLAGATLVRANLVRANLTRAHLRDAYLNSAYLNSANLTGATLTGAVLIDAHLTGADLTRAYLGSATLTRADLTRADLTGADLRYAYLNGATLTGATLTGAVLIEADLTGAIWPADAPIPEGWNRDASSGRLGPAGTGDEQA
jgi:type II secretory pathway component PulM